MISTLRDALAPRNASDSAARVRRHKSVTCSPRVSLYNITLYYVVYGVHPREFDFDERGLMASRQRSHLAPLSREIGVREAPAIISRLSNILFPLDGSRSQEEECKHMKGRSSERDGWQAGVVSADRSGTEAAVTLARVAVGLKHCLRSGSP